MLSHHYMTESQIEQYRALVQQHDAEQEQKKQLSDKIIAAAIKKSKDDEIKKEWKRQVKQRLDDEENQAQIREHKAQRRAEYQEWCQISGVDKYIDCIFEDMREYIRDLINDEQYRYM